MNVARPSVTLLQIEGGQYVAVVNFPPGLFSGRRPVVGPAAASPQAAVAAALAQAAPVIAQILTA